MSWPGSSQWRCWAALEAVPERRKDILTTGKASSPAAAQRPAISRDGDGARDMRLAVAHRHGAAGRYEGGAYGAHSCCHRLLVRPSVPCLYKGQGATMHCLLN